MKKKNLKNLKLNKKSIANLDQIKAGEDGTTIIIGDLTTIIPFCQKPTTLSCVLICVTKLGCDKD
ncbi:hypothetical protein [Kordia sp.]|uniref:hypothetical protein n=1 Tax=Kordia sp. TaxID=1965332 RepID=UPI003D6C181A